MKVARFACLAALAATLLAPAVASPAPSYSIKPLIGRVPDWYTPELRARVIAAGAEGVALPQGAAVPASSLAFLGIRPGQLLLISNGALCTSNFVFGSPGSYAIGTAGHCGDVGDQVTMVTGPGVLINVGRIIRSTGDGGIGNDFALIEIRPQVQNRVSPSMAVWGGPTGSFNGPNAPLLVKHTGWGLVIGTGGTPRVGLGTSWGPNEYQFRGAAYFGDSGSAVEGAAGMAIGNLTHIQVIAGLVPTGLILGTSMPRILAIAGLPLATCRNIPWPLFGCPAAG